LTVDPFEAIVTLRKPEVRPVRDKVADYGNYNVDERHSFRAVHHTSKRLRRPVGG
jgi:hypothetical protein